LVYSEAGRKEMAKECENDIHGQRYKFICHEKDIMPVIP
jgi:hypothetical protein